MFFAAFSSRSMTSPQDGQIWVRTERLFWTRSPQPLQSWLVHAGGTATTHLPAYAALLVRMVRNCAHPASLMLFARRGFRTRLRTCKSSRESTSYLRTSAQAVL